MNLTVTKGPIGISELVYSTTTEQALECDVMLPDFCPDIVRVLSCQSDTTLTDTSHAGGRLSMDGVAKLTVLYLDAEGGVRKTEYKLPYSKTLEMKSAPDHPIVTASAETAYVNCRAVGPRRLDIRGAVSIAVKVWMDKEEEAVINAEGEGIQLKVRQVESCRVIGRMRQPVTLQEELEVPHARPEPTHIVLASGAATVSECRCIGGRVVIKGEVNLRICYAGDEQCRHLETADYVIPVSQIVDMQGAGENCACESWLSVCGCDIEITKDPAGAVVFEVEVSMIAGITLCENRLLALATDCYSTRFPCEGRRKKLPLAIGNHRINEKHAFKTMLDVGEDLDSIVHVWMRPEKVSCQSGPEGGVVTGRLLVSILGATGNGIDYRERTADFSLPLPIKPAKDFIPDIGLSLPSASLTSLGQMELKCEVYIGGASSEGSQIEALTDIHLDTAAPLETDPAIGMRIYFTDPGESVWDIAKRYHTSEAMIVQDNGLESDFVSERRALIIPSV